MNQEFENLARNILIDCDVLNQLPVNLSEIAKVNNIDIFYVDLPDDVSGAIKFDQQSNKFKILIKKTLTRTRQRFTLAHELAHYFLEKDLLRNTDLHIDVLYRRENEAESHIDYFAGALLMDRSVVEDLYSVTQSISSLASAFGVSESAMRMRLKSLGII